MIGARRVSTPLAWHLEQTAVEGAWAVTRGEGVTIAVVDAGIDVRHPEFLGRVRAPAGPTRRRRARERPARESHGTKVAGVACAGGSVVTGVAPAARLMPIEVPALERGVGSRDEAEAIRRAAEEGADVICCAWGPSDTPPAERRLPDETRRAVRWATRHGRGGLGCPVVWAVGNLGADVAGDGYASNPDVIAVGACNDEGRRPDYSDRGAAVFCVFPSHDPGDRYAPHREVATTAPLRPWAGDSLYTRAFGHTSASCAGVAGVCALILGANPGLDATAVRTVLRLSCERVGGASARYDARGHSPEYGYGRPNATRAVRIALGADRERAHRRARSTRRGV